MAYGQKTRKPKADKSLKGVKENPVVNAVMKYLKLKKIPRYRVNSGAMKTPSGGWIKFGFPGMSDVYAIGPAGISIWIECKRPVGGVLSEAQREFLDCVNRNGGIGIVVNSIESLEKQLKEAEVI
jgi:hypothetical protein